MNNGNVYLKTLAAEQQSQLAAKWWLFVGVGIVAILLGAASLVVPLVATLTTAAVLGYLLLFGGVVEVGTAFGAAKWSGFFLQILVGVLHGFIGLLMVANPGLTAAAFTLMLAAFFLVGGTFRIILAISERFPAWGWVAFNGIVTLLLGILIWRQWPEASLWVIGTFVGIDLLFTGTNWLAWGLAFRSASKTTLDSEVAD